MPGGRAQSFRPPERLPHDTSLPLVLPPNIMLPGWKVMVVTDQDEVTLVFDGVLPARIDPRPAGP